MASNAGPCTLGRAHAAQTAVENPKREYDGQRARAAHVEAWHAKWAVCTRVDGGENEGVGQVEVEAEQGDTLKKLRAHRAVAKMRVQDPGRAEENAAAPVGVGDTPDKAHDDQTLGCDGMDAAPDGDEREVEVGNDVQDGHRGGMVDDDLVAAVVVSVAVEVDDEEASDAAVVAVVAVVVAAAAVVAVAVAVAAYA